MRKFRCHCGAVLTLDGNQGGNVLWCQNCGQPLELPAQVAPPQAAPPTMDSGVSAPDAGGGGCQFCAKFAGVAERCGVCGKPAPPKKRRRSLPQPSGTMPAANMGSGIAPPSAGMGSGIAPPSAGMMGSGIAPPSAGMMGSGIQQPTPLPAASPGPSARESGRFMGLQLADDEDAMRKAAPGSGPILMAPGQPPPADAGQGPILVAPGGGAEPPAPQAPILVAPGPKVGGTPFAGDLEIVAVDEEGDEVIEAPDMIEDDDDDAPVSERMMHSSSAGAKRRRSSGATSRGRIAAELTESGERRMMSSSAAGRQTSRRRLREAGEDAMAASGVSERRRKLSPRRSSSGIRAARRSRASGSTNRAVAAPAAMFACANCGTETSYDLLECDGCGLPIPRGGPRGGGGGLSQEQVVRVAVGAVVIGVLAMGGLVGWNKYKEYEKSSRPDVFVKNTPADPGPAAGKTDEEPEDPKDPPPDAPEKIDIGNGSASGPSPVDLAMSGVVLPKGPERELIILIAQAKTNEEIEKLGLKVKDRGERTVAQLSMSFEGTTSNRVVREKLARGYLAALEGDARKTFIGRCLSDQAPSVACWAAEKALAGDDPDLKQKVLGAPDDLSPAHLGKVWATVLGGEPLPTDAPDRKVLSGLGRDAGPSRVALCELMSGAGQSLESALDFLADEDPRVRDLAARVLRTSTGRTFGFDANGPEEGRKAAAREWKTFVAAFANVRNKLRDLAQDRDQLVGVGAPGGDLSEQQKTYRRWIETKKSLAKGSTANMVDLLLAALQEGEPPEEGSLGALRSQAYFEEALDILGIVAKEDDLPKLQKAFVDGAGRVGLARDRWPFAIAHAGGPKAVPFLVEVAAERRELGRLAKVQLIADAIAEVVGDPNEERAAVDDAAEKLEKALATMSGDEWAAAVRILLLLGRESGVDLLLRSHGEGSPPSTMNEHDLADLLGCYRGNNSAVVDRLVELGKDGNTSRSRLAEKLGEFKLLEVGSRIATPSDWKTFFSALEDELEGKKPPRGPAQLDNYLEALARIGKKSNAKRLYAILGHEGMKNRQQSQLRCAEVIARIGGSGEGKKLAKFFEEAGTQFNAYKIQKAEVLARAGYKDALVDIRADLETALGRYDAFLEAVSRGEQPGVPPFPRKQVEVISRVGGDKEDRALLLRLLKIANRTRGAQAALLPAVARFSDDDVGQLLFGYLSPNVEGHRFAAIGAARSGHPEATNRLIGMLGTPDEQFKPDDMRPTGILLCIARSDPDRGVQETERYIKKKEEEGELIPAEGWVEIAYVLGSSKKPEAVDKAVELASHPDPRVRAAVARAFSLAPDDAGAKAARVIADMLLDPVPEVRVEAALATIRLGAEGDAIVAPLVVGARAIDEDFLGHRTDLYFELFDHPSAGRSVRHVFAEVAESAGATCFPRGEMLDLKARATPNVVIERLVGRSVQQQVLRSLGGKS